MSDTIASGTPSWLKDLGEVLGRLNPQVKPSNGGGVHLGLPPRPRPPRPHPSPGLVQGDRVGGEPPSRATGGHINRRGMGYQVGGSYLLLLALLSLVGTLPVDSRSTFYIFHQKSPCTSAETLFFQGHLFLVFLRWRIESVFDIFIRYIYIMYLYQIYLYDISLLDISI